MWECDDIEMCWIYPPVLKYHDTDILWTIEEDGVYVFEVETQNTDV